jgi:hypothetical protein
MGAFGKQRRTADIDDALAAAGVEQSFCDPLIGVKGGLQFQVNPNMMFAPAVGVAFNLDDSERTSVFADAELNYTFDNGGYIGTGLGVWDMFDDATLNLLLHAGAPVARYPDGRARLLFVIESRLFFDELDNIDNNYQFWGGLRYVFR